MEFEAIISAVGSLGFPICACVALFYQMNKQNDLHKEEMDTLRVSIDNNTIALTKLLERIGANGET